MEVVNFFVRGKLVNSFVLLIDKINVLEFFPRIVEPIDDVAQVLTPIFVIRLELVATLVGAVLNEAAVGAVEECDAGGLTRKAEGITFPLWLLSFERWLFTGTKQNKIKHINLYLYQCFKRDWFILIYFDHCKDRRNYFYYWLNDQVNGAFNLYNVIFFVFFLFLHYECINGIWIKFGKKFNS